MTDDDNDRPMRMPAPLHNGRMLLTPTDATARVRAERLAACLQTCGLISESPASGPWRYRSGSRLFELVAFTGCAVQLDPADDATTGLQIAIEGPFGAPRLRSGRNSRPPRCPSCRRPYADWAARAPELAAAWAGEAMAAAGGAPHDDDIERSAIRCPSCGAQHPGWEWDWGRHAGYGSVFVTLEPVFPGEARPLPALFAALDEAGGGPWTYFYVQD
jgi:hypothetical protein